MNKKDRLERYVYEFFSSRLESMFHFYRSTHRDRHFEMYKLKEGTKLMDLVISIHAYFEESYSFEKLIPQHFATPEALLRSLFEFKEYLISYQKYIDLNKQDTERDYLVNDLQKRVSEIVEAIDYAKQIYDKDEAIVPYSELRYKLIVRDIDGFIFNLKSILASVSYAITKVQEGYFHSNVHIVLKLLGFDIISEEITNNGRIDAVIRLSDVIYILEFKFNKSKDVSDAALKQIEEKEYHLKFNIEQKTIFGLGVSFDSETRNINGFAFKKLS
ncbi:PD-(D/E)XK nuclease domain-containing protein [Myroides profundi]|uniref:PD-(D/E)XK nuclease superfamily protein n=1 Tax=Myroides profundi TaxID=480520 RepID=A0AAJ4W460_MYRPR|nr:PD-(D/E)XK nuclease domain-containing protein [Myroides profundi]SEQ94097.1 PD-(D/E)XK nuclease superfamily protein [Myroides profundi]